MLHEHPTRRPTRTTYHRGGFSFVELMAVLVVIGLLAGLVAINVRGSLIRAKQNAARSEISTICSALEMFSISYDRYPTTEEGLDSLARSADPSSEPLLKQAPIDPWGRPYQYNQPGKSHAYEVISFGADGREGGEGADADIVSWELKERRSLSTTEETAP